ncbi:Ribonuclease/ribotoxin [Cercophora newfieldiana]|uniref:ribonuclease T1 n=1 Tax=Cercophora newfieldiana TaxID=92897 RepID=A0AA40CXS5_9PEZI|nr:Ribonuclease/ribotoxin [Cercophora newfieldiana]
MVNLTALTTALLIAVAAGQGTASLSSVTCGSNKYTRKQVDEATAEGCRLFAEGRQLGNNNYPHQFNNREALVFAASGPYQEFPILTSGNYTGRSPGADRIVFHTKPSCAYVGAMTHTDAPTNNGFVLCTEAKGSTSPSPSATKTPTSSSANASSTAESGAVKWRDQGWWLGALLAPLVVA